MRHTWRYLPAVTVTAALAALAPLTASPALADGRPPVDPDPSNRELAQRLHVIEKKSRGAVAVDSIGTTNQDRPIYAASVGEGPLRLLYVTQQHGNEPLGTPAALEFLEDLGTSRSAADRELLQQVTLDVVVRANPDGSALDQRYNHDPEADPEYGEPGVGYDPNRYHDPAVAPEDNPVPEAAAIRRLYEAADPALVVDYHMQGRYTDGDGREITASVLWPTAADTDPAVETLSKQATAVSAEAIDGSYGEAHTSLYPGGGYEGIARNGYGLLGSGSVLVELSATGPDWEQEQISSAYASMDATLRSAADGSLTEVDPGDAERLPERGDPIPDAGVRALVEGGDDLD
ncbi:M14 family zinc carboxypeptidase [Nocardiopsis coralliicola]